MLLWCLSPSILLFRVSISASVLWILAQRSARRGSRHILCVQRGCLCLKQIMKFPSPQRRREPSPHQSHMPSFKGPASLRGGHSPLHYHQQSRQKLETTTGQRFFFSGGESKPFPKAPYTIHRDFCACGEQRLTERMRGKTPNTNITWDFWSEHLFLVRLFLISVSCCCFCL